MAASPNTKSINVENKATKREIQDENVEAIALRIRKRAADLSFNARSLGEALGIPSSSAANYWNGKRSWPSEVLPRLADTLHTNVDALLRGKGRTGAVVAVEDADWVQVPEYSLFEIDEFGKLDPISAIPMRKDWLYTSLGENSGLWLARLPARYDALTIGTGTPLFCKDHRPGERLTEGTYYLFRINGGIVMAPFTYRDGGSTDDAVHSRDLGNEEDQYQVVARVVGQLARPI